jgi:hypothetical protein
MYKVAIAAAAIMLVSTHAAGPDGCPPGYYFEPHTRKCLPLCTPGYYFDEDVRKCLPSDKKPPSSTCPPGYYFEPHTRKCLPLNVNEQVAEAVGLGCPYGTYNDGKGHCIPIPDPVLEEEENDDCPPGWIYNPNTGKCIRPALSFSTDEQLAESVGLF